MRWVLRNYLRNNKFIVSIIILKKKRYKRYCERSLSLNEKALDILGRKINFKENGYLRCPVTKLVRKKEKGKEKPAYERISRISTCAGF